MKPVGPTLDSEIKSRGLVKARIAEAYGISRQNFGNLLKCKSMDLAKYEKLCNIIGCSPTIVFEDGIQRAISIGAISQTTYDGDASVSVNEGTLKMIDQLLNSKDKVIYEMENRIKEKDKVIKLLGKMIDPEKLTDIGI